LGKIPAASFLSCLFVIQFIFQLLYGFFIKTSMPGNKLNAYIGEYRYGKFVTPGGMPAIVSEEIFNKVQDRMEANKHKPTAKKAIEEYILTTKLFCGMCGVMMTGTSGTSKPQRQNSW